MPQQRRTTLYSTKAKPEHGALIRMITHDEAMDIIENSRPIFYGPLTHKAKVKEFGVQDGWRWSSKFVEEANGSISMLSYKSSIPWGGKA